MTATKKVRVDRALSTNNDSDASVASFLTVAAGAPGFNTSTGVISIPNNTSQLTNGAGFITSSALSGYQTSLVSGTSIKTVNNTSLLGSGNISITSTSLLPSQSGNSGKYLTTDGSGTLSWATVSGGGGTDYSTATDVKIGYGSGTNQGSHSIAIGHNAGSAQSFEAIAIGYGAGSNQAHYTVAIGESAGANNQSVWGVAIGYMAGWTNQGGQAIAIGCVAGEFNQGANAIAIGANAGTSSQAANSIELNASGNAINPTTQGFFVAPVRSDATPTKIIYYNTVTKEMTYGDVPAGSSGGGGGGGNAGVIDNTQFKRDMTFVNNDYSMPFELPTGFSSSTPVLVVAMVGGGTNTVTNIGPPSWMNIPAGGTYPPIMSLWIATTGHSGGTQMLQFLDMQSGYVQLQQFLLDSSSTSQLLFVTNGMTDGMTGSIPLPNLPQMFGTPPYNNYSTFGYAYGFLAASGGPTDWEILKTLAPSPGVTIGVDNATQLISFKCPGSIWSTGGNIGTITGTMSSIMITGYFFGM